jgi:hypothetical protein
MSMQLSIYIGPYLVLPDKWDWEPWERILTDGRMEAGTDDGQTILVPTADLPGVTRQMSFDKYSQCPIVPISQQQQRAEVDAFYVLALSLIDSLRRSGIKYEVLWGIVPCWS